MKPNAGPIGFSISSNPVHGLVVFVETIAGNPHRSKTFQEYYTSSTYFNLDNQKHLDRWNELGTYLRMGYEFDAYPSERGQGQSIEKILLIQSAYATSLRDLAERTQGILPVPVAAEVFAILRHFEPIYKQLVWTKEQKRLTAYVNRLQSIAKTWQTPTKIRQIANFYGASWPGDIDFQVSVYPMPGNSGNSKAESLSALQSVGVFTQETIYEERFGVIIHEFCHSLYAAQPPAVQRQELAWFHVEGKFGFLAFHSIDEAMATAIGNGYVGESLTGQAKQCEWYNHHETNIYAKAIYPMVKTYLDSGKSIDQVFVKTAVKTFERLFPEAPREYSQILRNVSILTDDIEHTGTTVGRSLRQRFRVPSLSRYSPIISGVSDAQTAHLRGETVLVVTTPAAANSLKDKPSGWAALDSLFSEAKTLQNNQMLSVYGTNAPIIILIAKDQQSLDALLDTMHADKALPKVKSI